MPDPFLSYLVQHSSTITSLNVQKLQIFAIFGALVSSNLNLYCILISVCCSICTVLLCTGKSWSATGRHSQKVLFSFEAIDRWNSSTFRPDRNTGPSLWSTQPNGTWLPIGNTGTAMQCMRTYESQVGMAYQLKFSDNQYLTKANIQQPLFYPSWLGFRLILD